MPNPARRSAWMNWAILAANVVVFLYERRHPAFMPEYQLTASSLRLWMFISYAFLHVGWAHLIFNMVALGVFGPNINRRLGNFGYLGFYLGGAVASAAGFVATGGQAMVGASGAVGAVMGAHLVLVPRATISLFILVGVLETSSFYFVMAFFSYNVLMAIVSHGGPQPVAYEAHIAGILFGVISMLVLLGLKLAPREPLNLPDVFDRWRRRRSLRRMAVAGGAAAETWDAGGGRPADDTQTLRIASLRVQIAEALAQSNIPAAAERYLELRRLDPRQFLTRQAQLDVAAQFASDQRYPEAAEAYEVFLDRYPAFDQLEEVQLMLGLIYARYLDRPRRARQCLQFAIEHLKGAARIHMAQEALDSLRPEEGE